MDAEQIKLGLIQRGLPPHVADGFLMNFQDESGLDAGINEISPLVPGSRGGFGLYQLTGPRRVAYENYAQERGVDVADPNAQLDFLMMELQGPESRAARSILSAPDANTAAVAIARDFLRPAPENLEKRIRRYAGGQGMPSRSAPTQQQAMQQATAQDQQQPVAQGYRPSMSLVDLYGTRPSNDLSQVYSPLDILERFRVG
jgi:hypothetical protein